MVAGALVVSALVAEVAHLKMAAGADPVALRSQNLPGSEEANEELIARYRKRSRLYESRCGSVQPGITPIYSPIGGGDLAEHLLLASWHQVGIKKGRLLHRASPSFPTLCEHPYQAACIRTSENTLLLRQAQGRNRPGSPKRRSGRGNGRTIHRGFIAGG
jgi:hypothetical protein